MSAPARLFSQVDQQQPYVILITSAPASFGAELKNFLEEQLLPVQTLTINEDLLSRVEQLLTANDQLYKIVIANGFFCGDLTLEQLKQENRLLFAFLKNFQANWQFVDPPEIIYLSSYLKNLAILDNPNQEHAALLQEKQRFLRQLLLNFAQLSVFLAQDLFIGSQALTHPYRLFFSAFPQRVLLDPQSNIYWLNQEDFLQVLRQQLLKPGQAKRFLLRGKSRSSQQLLHTVQDLYQRYYQEKLQILKLISSEEKDPGVSGFVRVRLNSNPDADLDQFVRVLPELRPEQLQSALYQPALDSLLAFNQRTEGSEQDSPLDGKKIATKDLQSELEKTAAAPATSSKASAEPIVVKGSIPVSTTAKEGTLKSAVSPNQAKSGGGKIDEKLQAIFKEESEEQQSRRLISKVKTSQKIQRKTRKRRLLFVLGSLILTLSSISLLLYFTFNATQQYLQHNLQSAVRDSLTTTNNKEKIDLSILNSKTTRLSQGPIFKLLQGQNYLYSRIFTQSTLSESLELEQIIKLFNQMQLEEKIYQENLARLFQLTLRGEGDLSQAYQDLSEQQQNLAENSQQLFTLLSQLNLELYQEEERAAWEKLQGALESAVKNQLLAHKALIAWQNFILQKGRNNVLVLFQDNSELRSSGGYLSAALLLAFDNGFLTDQQFLDITQVEAGNYGQKAAPEEVRELLGEEQLYFADSNWAADFTRASQDIKWYVEQSNGSRINLVVALNYLTVREWLQQLEPLALASGESITTQNFYSELENKLVQDSRSGSNQDFPGQLIKALIKKIQEQSEPAKVTQVFKIFNQSLVDKETLLWSADEQLQTVIKGNVWSGELLKSICPDEFAKQSCFLDEFYQLENNIGINKVNHYISQKIEHNLGITEEFIRHKHVVHFTNHTRNPSWPLGTYRGYLKFYLPLNASLEKLLFAGRSLDLGRTRQYQEGDRQVVTALIEVPAGEERDLELTYLVPNNLKSPFSYVFLDQKQPGVEDKNTTYNIVFADNFRPQLIAPTANYQNQVISFENNNDQHFVFAVSFQ